MAEDNLLGSTPKRGPGRPSKLDKQLEEAEAKAAGEVAGAVPVNVSIPAEQVEPETYTLTKDEMRAFRQLLAKAQDNAVTAGQEVVVKSLIEAIRESRKPYESDADKANRESQRQQMRRMVQREKRNRISGQSNCRHMAGCNPLSHREADTTGIIWHEILEHLWWGECSVCQRQFWPTDPDYNFWRRKRSYNTPSRAGERLQEVDAKTFMEEEHLEPFPTSPVPQFVNF